MAKADEAFVTLDKTAAAIVLYKGLFDAAEDDFEKTQLKKIFEKLEKDEIK